MCGLVARLGQQEASLTFAPTSDVGGGGWGIGLACVRYERAVHLMPIQRVLDRKINISFASSSLTLAILVEDSSTVSYDIIYIKLD